VQINCEVFTESEPLREGLEGPIRRHKEKDINYIPSHRDRPDYGSARPRGDALGSAAIESTSPRYQTSLNHTGQCSSQTGNEPLMCLETFRCNARWHILFPHSKADPPKTAGRLPQKPLPGWRARQTHGVTFQIDFDGSPTYPLL